MAPMEVKCVSDICDPQYDSVIFVSDDYQNQPAEFAKIASAIQQYNQINKGINCGSFVILFPDHPSNRLIYAATGPLNQDVSDARCIYEAAIKGVEEALKSGSKKPLLVLGKLATAPADQEWAKAPNTCLTATLGALHALYTPLEIREDCPDRVTKATLLGLFSCNEHCSRIAQALEEARRVARDIGGSDPERMAAPRVAEYVLKELGAADSGVSVSVKKVDGKEYPLMAAVDRCASQVPRHEGRVVHLEYDGGNVDTSVFLVGKGITYDTGGNDIKAGGHMAGMHRDKCGAAAVCGFFKLLSLLRPVGLKVSGACAFVRNSCGSNAYVADEIITSRAKRRVRVGNTDAEGRMVMADLLCEAKEKAQSAVNPHIFTVATLTGHVIRAWGDAYTAALDNGLAKKHEMSRKLQAAGDLLAEPVEISSIRREDYKAHKGPSEYEDILQAGNNGSVNTPRGHMTPAAFMIMASGLDSFGLDSQKPLAYTHLDVAGSSGPFPGVPTGAPITALATHFVLPRIKK